MATEASRSIRIIQLDPALLSSSKLRIQLTEKTLSVTNPLRYEAVSYVWGSSSQQRRLDRPIICYEKTLLVTRNCEEALLRLRRRTKPRFLWIDAICIDQSSVRERGQQVELMGDVFRSAERVVIWIGESTKETTRAFEYLEAVAHDRKLLEDRNQKWPGEYTEKNDDDKKAGDATRKIKLPRAQGRVNRNLFHKYERKRVRCLELFLCWMDCMGKRYLGISSSIEDSYKIVLRDIFHNPYFTRMWTLQECVLARSQRAILQCGKKNISWDIVLMTYDKYFYPDLRNDDEAVVNAFHSHYQLDMLLKAKMDPRLHEAPLHRRRTNPKVVRPEFNDFFPMFSSTLALLDLARRQQCMDPRDKIFALDGILRELGIMFPKPDYSKSVEQIYLEAATAVIQHDQNLSLLYFVSSPQRRKRLPSWVPDWSNGWNIDGTGHDQQYKRFKAALCGPRYSFYVRGRSLYVAGKLIDKIKRCAKSLSFAGVESSDLRYILRDRGGCCSRSYDAVLAFGSWIQCSRRLRSYPTGEPVKEAFRQTMVYDALDYESYRLDSDDSAETFIEWYKSMTAFNEEDTKRKRASVASAHARFKAKRPNSFSPLAPEQTIKSLEKFRNIEFEFQTRIWKDQYGKKFFTTEAGYMGTAETTVRQGDVIALLPGMEMPIILRRAIDGGYHFIGPAYVHGIMNGEIWLEDSLQTRMIRLV
ncbi:MAG: hypothetical protein M1834_007699 [Cirrosporium novae-zelandiae]|nr:MAG: hypothetical protein M1834_007699 [Cirrosporium novae-zelandiae]